MTALAAARRHPRWPRTAGDPSLVLLEAQVARRRQSRLSLGAAETSSPSRQFADVFAKRRQGGILAVKTRGIYDMRIRLICVF